MRLFRDEQGYILDRDANAPEFESLDDEPLDAVPVVKGQRKGHYRTEESGKRTYVRTHTVKDRPHKPAEKVDRMAHLSRLEQPRTPPSEWQGVKPKVARKPKKKGKKEAKGAGKTVTTVTVVAVGTLSLADRKRLFEARLTEMGLVRGKNMQAAMLTPESKRHLGYYVDLEGERHPIKVPTGRKVGRPSKGKATVPPAEPGTPPLLAAIKEAVPDADVPREFLKTVRVIYNEATGATTLILPAELDAFQHTAQAVRERERAWATEIAAHTLPDKPVTPTPTSNLDLVLDHLQPPKVREWVRRDCQRWENVIWQREQSPVRWEVQTPQPKGRPNLHVLVGVYETRRHIRSRREIVVFPASYSEWTNTEPAPPALGLAAGKQTYGQALLRRMPGAERSLLRSALALSPLFGAERDEAETALNESKPLTGPQVMGLALGLSSLNRLLTYNYWQAQAKGDDDNAAWQVVQRGHLRKLMASWGGLRVPATARKTLLYILTDGLTSKPAQPETT